MNIFFTSLCPVQSARGLCQRHIIKMLLESAQMLSTAHREFGNTSELLYKSTHKNHPSSVWVRKSADNYMWLYDHFTALCDLYTRNSGKTHLTESKLREVLSTPPSSLKSRGFRLPPMCMPEEFILGEVCSSYQGYLRAKYAEWGSRSKPLKVTFPHGEPDWLNS